MGHDVFVSAAAADRLAADALCRALEGAGIRCWMAPRDVDPGRPYARCIAEAIASCSLLVLVFSVAANESDHVAREVELAARERKPLLPVRVANVQPNSELLYFLGRAHWLDAFAGPLDAHLAAVVAAVRPLIGRAAEPSCNPAPIRASLDERPVAGRDSRGRAWLWVLAVLLPVSGLLGWWLWSSRPVSLAGSVVDEDGAPLASVGVGVSPLTGDVGRYERTDAEGIFAVSGLRPGSWALTFAASDHAGHVEFVDAAPGAVISDLRIVLSWVGTIEGRVVDASGAPVAGQEVSAFAWGDGNAGGFPDLGKATVSTATAADGPQVRRAVAPREDSRCLGAFGAEGAGAADRAAERGRPRVAAGAGEACPPPPANSSAARQASSRLRADARAGSFALRGLRTGEWLVSTATGTNRSARTVVALARGAGTQRVELRSSER